MTLQTTRSFFSPESQSTGKTQHSLLAGAVLGPQAQGWAKPQCRGTKAPHQFQAVTVCDSSTKGTSRACCRQVGHSTEGQAGPLRADKFKCLRQRMNGKLSDRGCPKAQKQGRGRAFETPPCPDLRLSVSPLRTKQPSKCQCQVTSMLWRENKTGGRASAELRLCQGSALGAVSPDTHKPGFLMPLCLLTAFTKSATGQQAPDCVPASKVVVPEGLIITESGAQVSS